MSSRFPEIDKHCEHCRKPLFGRTAKRFCNDHCRNTYNRIKAEQEKIQQHESQPLIFRHINRNYEILKKMNPEPMEKNESIYGDTADLLAEGFHPKYCTSIRVDPDGTIWRFCFERGYSIGEQNYTVIDDPEQAE